MKYNEIINELKKYDLVKDYTETDLNIENISYDSRDILYSYVKVLDLKMNI